MKLADLIHPSYIDLDLQAADKVGAIRSLAQRLAADGAVTSLDGYVEAVLAREKLYSTAVGYGVAVPHGKSHAVARPAVAFGYLQNGLRWAEKDVGDDAAGTAPGGAVDDPGELVRMVFLLAVPEAQAGDTHLRILARLARLLLDERFRAGLEAARTPDHVLEALGRVDVNEDAASGEEGEA